MKERWYRVFGSTDAEPAPAAILAHLHARGAFTGDAQGWFQAELSVEGLALHLERFLAGEEGIRAELNAWAAYLETCTDQPNHGPLMERMIQTRQLFTLRSAADGPAVALCRLLAEMTEGVYQADGEGFFAADGTLLIREK